MGCDIHAYIQYQKFEKFQEGWRMPFMRNYYAFGLLAGVRGGDAIFPQKGIPKDLAYLIRKDYLYYVADENTYHPGWCSKAQAAKWIASGISTKWEENFITDPDAHSCSWLSTKELKKVYDTYNKEVLADCKVHPKYKTIEGMSKIDYTRKRTCLDMHMILKNMQELEKCGYKDKVQFVFWFDN